MPQLTQAQVTQLAYDAGFRGNDLVKAVAIAGRESAYNPAAHRTDNPNGTTGDYGLWQINYVNDTAAMRQQVGYTSRNDLLNPVINAKVAFAIYDRNHGFSSWAAGPGGYTPSGDPLYGTDKYKQGALQAVFRFLLDKGEVPFLGLSHASDLPIIGPIISGVGNTVGAVKDSVNSVTDFLKLLTDSQLWIRVAQVVGGVVAVGMGFWILAHGTSNMVSDLPGPATLAVG